MMSGQRNIVWFSDTVSRARFPPKCLCLREAVVWSKALLVIYDSNRGESKVATTPETDKKLKQDNKVDKSCDFPVFSTPTMFPRPTMGKGGSNKCNNRRTMVAA